MELLMSLVVTALAIFLLFSQNKPLAQSDSNLVLGGSISGFLAGLIGTGGAIRGITLAAFQLPKDIFISSSAFIDLGVDTSRAIVYTASGYFSSEEWYLIPFLVAISIIGSLIGKKILQYTFEGIFRYLVLGLIVLTSVYQILLFFK